MALKFPSIENLSKPRIQLKDVKEHLKGKYLKSMSIIVLLLGKVIPNDGI